MYPEGAGGLTALSTWRVLAVSIWKSLGGGVRPIFDDARKSLKLRQDGL